MVASRKEKFIERKIKSMKYYESDPKKIKKDFIAVHPLLGKLDLKITVDEILGMSKSDSDIIMHYDPPKIEISVSHFFPIDDTLVPRKFNGILVRNISIGNYRHPEKANKMSRLNNDYEKTYFEMLQSFQKDLKKADKKYSSYKYSFLYPSFGSKFFEERKLIFYGQCINGEWQPQFKINGPLNNSIIKKGWLYSNTCNPKENDPLDWVNKNWSGYSLYRSFFWNVAYKLTNKLMDKKDYVNSADWSQYMAWSNLMKIGNTLGGNPDNKETKAQEDGCLKLFIMELEKIKPEIAVLLTGKSFANNFIEALNLKKKIQNKKFVILAEKFNGIKVILTRRPKVGNNEKCVAEILDAINML